jgi:hypothetical protein
LNIGHLQSRRLGELLVGESEEEIVAEPRDRVVRGDTILRECANLSEAELLG